MALSLDQLLDNRKSSPFILINDSVRFSALTLLAEFTARALNDNHSVITVLTETTPSMWRKRLARHTANGDSPSLHIIDAYTDPLGWDGGAASVLDMEQTILAAIHKIQNVPQCLIVIDSLHPLLMVSPHRTYQLVKSLESLTTDQVRLVVGFHADIRLPNASPIPTADALKRLASAIITVEPLPEPVQTLAGFVPQDAFSYMTPSSNLASRGGLAHLEWRRKSGKVTFETYPFYLGPKGVIVQKREEPVAVTVDVPTPDPTANLSFNLSLTDSQRQAKDNVVLPYLPTAQQEKPESGQIYYEPDAADDFDDEDPDDDLDI